MTVNTFSNIGNKKKASALKALLSSSALTAMGVLAMTGTALAKDVGDYDVWEFESFQSGAEGTITGQSQGYVQYSGDRIVGRLSQEDIGRLGHVDLQSNLTVATGAESGAMHILGKLTSTGEVFVFDVNGFLFGKDSVVDTAGFAAIGGEIVDPDSLGSGDSFDAALSADAKITIEEGAMINVAEAGLAAFVAPTVVNRGVINAKLGKVAFAAGETVTLDLYGDKLVEIAVDGELEDALLENTGTISAEGGTIQMTALAAKDAVDNVINLDGVTTVASATVQGGKIILSGGDSGVVKVSGSVDASGTSGGDIHVTGQNIHITETAEIKADGGQGADGVGDGGDVINFADNAIVFEGEISATGGDNGGDGGDAEVSGVNYIGYEGVADLRAANGATGTLLLDPTNVDIIAGFAGTIGAGVFNPAALAVPSTTLGWDTIVAALGFGNVTVTTTSADIGAGRIRVVDSRSYDTANSLILLGHANVIVNDGVTIENLGLGDITLRSGWDGNLATPGFAQSLADFRQTIIGVGSTVTTGGHIYLLSEDRVHVKSDALVSGANVTTVSDKFIIDISGAPGSIVATDTVSIGRNTDGEISVGVPTSGTLISQAEVDRITADKLTIGNANTTKVNVEDVDTTGTIAGEASFEALAAGGEVNILGGANTFAALGVKATTKASITGDVAVGTGDVNVDTPEVDLDGDIVTTGTISGTATTVNVVSNSAEIEDGVDVAAAGATLNIAAGTYAQSTTVDKALDIKGDGVGSTIISAPTGDGFRLVGDQGAGNTTTIDGITFDGNAESGVDVDSATVLGELAITNSEFNNNGIAGVSVGGDASQTNLGHLNVQDSTFLDNGSPGASAGDGDIFAFRHNGDVTIKNVTIENNATGGAGSPADYGIQIRGHRDGGSNVFASGSLIFDNVNLSGAYRAAQLGIQEFDGITLSMTDVHLGGQTTALTDSSGWGSLYFSNIGAGSYTIGNTVFNGGPAALFQYIINDSDADFDATGATFEGVTGATATLDQNYAIEDRVYHTLDPLSKDGLVTWKTGNVFVTALSGSIQRGVDAASAGDNVNVDDGTFAESVTIDKTLNVLGNNRGISAKDGVRVAETIVTPAGSANGFTITGDDVVLDGFSIVGGGKGVEAIGADRVKIKNTLVTGSETGIYVGTSTNAKIDDNKIDGTTVGAGIEVVDSFDSRVRRNQVDGAATQGILVSGASNNTRIKDNMVNDAGSHGVAVDGVFNAQILDNIIDGSGASGVSVVNGASTLVKKNIIDDSTADGVTVSDSLGAFVRENEIDVSGGNGVSVTDSNRIRVQDNVITESTTNGVVVTGSYLAKVERNTIDTTGADGVEVTGSDDSRIAENLIGTTGGTDNIGAEGIDVNGSNGAEITGNTVTETVGNGISVNPSDDVDITSNTITDVGADGINVLDGSNLYVFDNTITTTGGDGVEVSGTWDVEIDDNTISGTSGHGIYVHDIVGDEELTLTVGASLPTEGDDDYVGEGFLVNITNNTVSDTAENGIYVDNVPNALIDNNTVSDTGRNGILASSVYGNGLTPLAIGGGEGVDGPYYYEDLSLAITDNDVYNTGLDYEANGITVDGANNALILNNTVLFAQGGNGIGFYYTDNTDVRNNVVALAAWNGIDGQYGYHSNVSNNIVGLTYNNGISLGDIYLTNVTDNLIGLTGGHGISVTGGKTLIGYFTNISDNKILLTGGHGIHVDGIYGGIPETWSGLSEGFGFDYYGPAVNVENNQVALIGGHGISVTDSGKTKIANNDVFATGLAFWDLISSENDFYFSPAGLGFEWGDGHGIYASGIEAYESGPLISIVSEDAETEYGAWYDYADLLVQGNNVSWTGGHGINASDFGVGVIGGYDEELGNDVRYAGIDGTGWGWETLGEWFDGLLDDGDVVIETGLDALFGDGNLVAFLQDVLPAPDFVEGDEFDGINIAEFGEGYIGWNTISFTGDDGIDAQYGDFVSIYDNYTDLSGFLPSYFGNAEVGEDANGIYVAYIGDTDFLDIDSPEIVSAEIVSSVSFGEEDDYETAVEIFGNDVANAEDDGIQVEYSESAYVGDNIVGHVGDDGIDIDEVGYVKVEDNAVTLAEDRGITIDGGYYAGVYDNRVLLTGSDGIQVENIRYDYSGDEDFLALGDEEYGYGWAVNVSGNDVAMTGGDGIEVRYSDATKVTRNDVFMAGLGEGLYGVIETVNDFANGTFNPFITTAVRSVSDIYDYDYFSWGWGDGHGINVHNIDGAYYSPNGWAADIRNNTVQWTGGHGIRAVSNDRTRIKNNTVRYAGIDETTFYGAYSMMDVISGGPFHSEGRRDLWTSEDVPMVEVLEGYFGREGDEPDDREYISIGYIDYDSHDGIHARSIYGQYDDGLSGADYLYDLKIRDNDVRYTGDDGIEAVYAGRTLIAKNTVRHAGYGDDRDYGSGDYYGADGIHARYIEADTYFDGYFGAGLGTGSESPENYALIIRGNNVRNTADDGIEVVGGSDVEIARADISRERYYYGSTDRVLIKNNVVRRAGDGYSYYDDYRTGPDGYGHDGIHVRGIRGERFDDRYDDRVLVSEISGLAGSGEGYEGFYGYAVDIIGNNVRRTGDDGIEVINSASTLIYDNSVRHAGVGGGYYYGGADYYGADGIHVRNVGGSNDFPWAMAGFAVDGFEPYAVVISQNRVNNTADDGIEVVGDGFDPRPSVATLDRVSDGPYYYGYTTDRVLIEDNVVANAGAFDEYYYEDRYYGGGTGQDGYGADGIHVRGVNGTYYYGNVESFAGGVSEGGFYGYAVNVIGNEIDRTGDDGIEVISSASTLIYDNDVSHAGVGGGYYYGGADYYGADGIHVRNVGGSFRGYPVGISGNGFEPYAVVIASNDVTTTQDDGIEVVGEGKLFNDISARSEVYVYPSFGGTGRTLIQNNTVDDIGSVYFADFDSEFIRSELYYYDDGYGADGIHVRGVQSLFDSYEEPYFNTITTSGFIGGSSGYDIQIINNTVTDVADDGIEVRGLPFADTDLLVDVNTVDEAGDNGILLVANGGRITFPETDTRDTLVGPAFLVGPYGEFNSDISGNEVSNSGTHGLHVNGYGHGDVVLTDNTFTDNLVGARFESGRVDVSDLENPNTFVVTEEFTTPEGFDYVTGMQFELAGEGDPTILTIADETLGATVFEGFAIRPVGEAYYVRFEDGAILDEQGDVIEIDGTLASWDGVVPNSFGNVLPQAVLDVIEDRLFDADDPVLNGRGQIFVGDPLLGLDNIEDFFNSFDGFSSGPGGLNVVVTGLPSVGPGGLGTTTGPTGPAALNLITPAAGDEGTGEQTEGDLADIEPAAGTTEDAACWGDAVGVAQGGAPVTYSFGGTFEESLADAAACNTAGI